MPLRDIPLVRPKGDLRVDRRRPPDAAAREESDDLAVRERREAERPEEVVCRLRLPAREVVGREMRADLEQQHVPPALRELPGDDAATGARAHDDDVEAVLQAHEIPRYDQSFARRVAWGELKSISAQAPGPSFPGATKSE